MAVSTQSLISIFTENTQAKAKNIALRHKKFGIWQQWTWLELSKQAEQYHSVLEKLSFKNKHDQQPRLLILSSPNLHFFALIIAAIKFGITVEFIESPLTPQSIQATIKASIQNIQPDLIFIEDLKQFEAVIGQIKEDQKENHQENKFSFDGILLYLEDHRLNPFPLEHAYALSEQVDLLDQSDIDHKLSNKNIESGTQSSTQILSHEHTKESQNTFVFHKTINDQAVYTTYRDLILIQEAETFIQAHQLTQDEQAFITRSFASHDHIRYLFSTWLIAGFCLNIPESFDTRDQDRQIISPSLILGTAETYQRVADLIQQKLPQSNYWIFKYLPNLKAWNWQFSDQYKQTDNLFEKIFNALFKQAILASLGFSHLRTAIVVGETISEQLDQFYLRLGIELKAWQAQAVWKNSINQTIQIQTNEPNILNQPSSSGDAYVTARHP